MTEKTPVKITKHMCIADVVQRYPETFEVFMRNGLHCVGCHVAQFETIEQGAIGHMIDADKLVNELNESVSLSKPKPQLKSQAKSKSKTKK